MTPHNNNQRKITAGGKHNEKKKSRKKRLIRFALISCVLLFLASASATYHVVSAYLAEVPEWDPERLLPSQTSFMYDRDGVLISRLLGTQNRIPVELSQISPDLINAFIAIEDARFFEHPGLDIRGIMRAVYSNLFRSSGPLQGGSTIPQQLIKNAFFDPRDRTMRRKIQELYLTYRLERTFTKDEILSMYLNFIFFDFNAYGVEAAAQTYFGKSSREVTLAEAAILAGIPNLPGRYSPWRNIAEAKSRQGLVLSRMVDLGMITEEDATKAREEELALVERPEQLMPFPWFSNQVLEDAHNILAETSQFATLSAGEIWDVLYGGGLHIYTTLDREKQAFIEETIDNDALYPRIRNDDHLSPVQAAVIVAEPATGHIVAMSGGRDHDPETNGMNRAIRGQRPAGSTLKPILAYAPAFNEGIASPGSIIDDAPGEWGNFRPTNYNPREYNGLVTNRYSLLRSLNLPAVRLFQQVGISKGKEYAERMGIANLPPENELGIVLGGGGTGFSVYEVAQAFAVLANEGVRTDFATITKITDSEGKIIYENKLKGEDVLSPEAAWLTTDVLKDAVLRGTAAGVRIGRPLAAKTGTSDLSRDVWLAAYTPDYVTVFWLGRDRWPDKTTDGNFSSGRHTNPFMNPILKFIHRELPERDFTRPDNLVKVTVCSKSGLRPGTNCPPEHLASDWFLPRNVPTQTCDIHVELEISTQSGLLAGQFCPENVREKRVFLDRPPFITTTDSWRGGAGLRPADAALMPPSRVCPLHTFRPDMPQNLEAAVDEEGNLTLTWTVVSNARGYFIYRRDPGSGSFELLNEHETDKLNFTDQGLIPGYYSYQVLAISAEGVSSERASISVTVQDLSQQPQTQQPENPDSSSNNGNDTRSNRGNNRN
ncbi:MAG: transglycosylase domain-containing protein [Dethiobacter sp.]|nr:transglycosylase domain-containing protein [Dethiobacter sp.]MBS3988340.1 transglycosylase domain-containing protein [Dethiobacter sp.]